MRHAPICDERRCSPAPVSNGSPSRAIRDYRLSRYCPKPSRVCRARHSDLRNAIRRPRVGAGVRDTDVVRRHGRSVPLASLRRSDSEAKRNPAGVASGVKVGAKLVGTSRTGTDDDVAGLLSRGRLGSCGKFFDGGFQFRVPAPKHIQAAKLGKLSVVSGPRFEPTLVPFGTVLSQLH